MCKNHLISYYGVPEKDIRLIYNGVDLKRFNAGLKKNFELSARKKLGIKETETVLLFAGHNYKRKGLKFAIQCAYALKKQGYKIKLIVAGRRKKASFLRTLGKNRFSDVFKFLGDVTKIEDLYHASDILIHPAFYEPFSNACLEAMACGLPVVTTKQNGASEIIEDGISGFVVEFPWEVERMVSSISSILQNQGEALKLMGDRSARCAENYSMEKNIQKTVDVYEEILNEKEDSGSKKGKGP